MDKKPSKNIVPASGGILQELTLRSKLLLRLLGDRRISTWIKLIPLGALLYFVSPIDLIPAAIIPGVGALDDAAILWLGYYTFLELCPPEVVRELTKKIVSNNSIVEDVKNQEAEEIVDGEATDVTDR